MPAAPDDNPRDPKAIRRAPVSGEVVSPTPRPVRPAREIDEDPSEEDIAKLDSPTRTCPHCGREVYDDAEVCYHCGHAFMAGERATPWLQIAVAGLLILVFLVIFGLRWF